MTDRLEALIREIVREELAAARPKPQQLLSVEQAADALGLGRTLVYQEISRGRLRSVRIGRRRLIPASAIDEYADSETPAWKGRALEEDHGATTTAGPVRPS
jgi:excisionase family DNA binding protein